MPSKFHRSIGRPCQDTQADIDHRIAARAAGEQAVREREIKFPTLTAENVGEAMSWQEARLRKLMAPIDAHWHTMRWQEARLRELRAPIDARGHKSTKTRSD